MWRILPPKGVLREIGPSRPCSVDTVSARFSSLQGDQPPLSVMKMAGRDGTQLQLLPSHLTLRGRLLLFINRNITKWPACQNSHEDVQYVKSGGCMLVSSLPHLLPCLNDLAVIERSPLTVSCAPDSGIPRLHVHRGRRHCDFAADPAGLSQGSWNRTGHIMLHSGSDVWSGLTTSDYRLLDAQDSPIPSHQGLCPCITKCLASFCQTSLPRKAIRN